MQRVLRSIIFLTLSLLTLFCSAAYADSLSSLSVDSAPLVTQSTPLDGMVRVYLSSLGSPSSLTIKISGSYSLSDGTTLTSGETLTVSFSSSTGELTLKRNGTTYSMGKNFTLRRHSTTGSNGVKITQARKPENLYPGDLEFKAVSASGGYKLYTIAHIYIENYLYGVVPYEMGSSAPLEALKAQAVAARTYTVRMMSARSATLYDVVDTTGDQTYNGTPTSVTNCNTAVDQTKGIILKNGSAYTATYYSSSNGGQTESVKNAWGSTGYSYLDVHDDPFDYANPDSVVRQTTVYADASNSANNAALMSLLKSKAITLLSAAGYNASGNTTLLTIKSITPNTPKYASPSKLYTKMDFTLTLSTYNASNMPVSVTTTVTCDIFGELESMLSLSIQSGGNELWTVVEGSGSFAIQARRYGHAIGMSQRGAMYMGQLGFTYDEILGFYYVNSTRVGCTFTNTILSADSSEVITTDEDPVSMDGETGVRGIVSLGSGEQLAVRSAKSATATVLTVLANSTPVTVLANYGSWCKIAYGSIVGYVPTSALTITGTAPESDDTPVSGVAGFAVVTSSSYLNLRQSAGYSSTILSTAPGGAILTVLTWGTDWAYIQYGKLVAYAASDYLSFSQEYPGTISESGSSDPGSDETAEGAVTAIVATDSGSLNMRSQAKAGSSVVTTIPQGAMVSVTELGTTWSAVTYFGFSGYVMTAYLSFEGESGSQDTGETADTYAKVTTSSGSLNLRQLPKAGSSIYCTIPQYAVITVHTMNGDWSNVTYNGVTGYVMTAFLTVVDSDTAGQTDENTDPDGEPAEPTATPEPSDTEPASDGTPTAIVTTASGSLNLRFDALPGSRVLTRIPQGTAVPVMEKLNTWTYTKYQDYYGYVMNTFLTFSNDTDTGMEPSEATPAIVVTASGSLNLRDEPYGRVVTTIPQNARVLVYQRGSAWCSIQYNNVSGYVMTAYLSFDGNTAAEEPDQSTGDPDSTPDDPDSTPDDGGSTPDGGTATVSVETGALNLRVEKSATAEVLTTIPDGTVVTLMIQGDEWCKVSYAGYQGYVQTQYLRFASASEPTATPQPTATPVPTALPGVFTAWVNTPDNGSLNLRSAPSGKVMTTIPQHAQVEVLSGIEDTWCKTRYESMTGYTMSKYLTTTRPQEAEAGESESTYSLTAWVNTPTGSLNLRNEPKGNVLTTIPQYAEVTVHSDIEAEWCKTQYGTVTGYTATEYLTTERPQQAAAAENSGESSAVTAWVNTPEGSLNLRSAPNGSVLTTIPQYAQVTVLSSLTEAWCQIQYNGITGYAVSKYLTTTKPSAATATTATIATSTPAATTAPAATSAPESGGDAAMEEEEIALDSTLHKPGKKIVVYVRPPAETTTLSLYDECSEAGAVLKIMPEGSEVEIVMAGDTWCEVRYNDQQGYCKRDGLSFFED